MQQIICQNININQHNKTVVLDEESTINIDKGLRNEERLRVSVSELVEVIRQKDSIIESLITSNKESINRHKQYIETINTLSDRLFTVQERLTVSTPQTKTRSVGGLFVGVAIDTEQRAPINIRWVSDRVIYEAGATILDQKPTYQLGLAVKLFSNGKKRP